MRPHACQKKGEHQDQAAAEKRATGPGSPVANVGEGRLVAAFAFFLAGAAQADAGKGLKAFQGDGFAAITATGYSVNHFRAAAVNGGTGTHEGGFPVQALQFCSLIKNVHGVSLSK